MAASREYMRQYMRRYRVANPERLYEKSRRETLRRMGLTQTGFDALLEFQGGRCAICGTTDPGGRGSRGNFHIDHDHACCPNLVLANSVKARSCGACVRGLLCWACNSTAGVLDWPIAQIEVLLRYRRDPPWPRLLAARRGLRREPPLQLHLSTGR